MNWEKLTRKQYHTEPVEYIYAQNIFDTKEYDRLYENQTRLNHEAWQEFDKQYRVGFEFREDITEINLDREVIAVWFFKERSDRHTQPFIDLSGKLLTYFPNTFILTKSKYIKIKEPKRKFIRRPMVQLDITGKQFDKIVERFK